MFNYDVKIQRIPKIENIPKKDFSLIFLNSEYVCHKVRYLHDGCYRHNISL